MTEQSSAVLGARYVMGAIPSWELPSIADTLLKDGPGTAAIVELATMRAPVMADAGPLFERALRERGIQIPTREEAVWTILKHYVSCIADGSRLPQDGLRLIMNEAYYPGKLHEMSVKYVGDSHDLQGLIGSYYEYDDLWKPEEIKLLDDQVIGFAKEWISKHDVTTPLPNEESP